MIGDRRGCGMLEKVKVKDLLGRNLKETRPVKVEMK